MAIYALAYDTDKDVMLKRLTKSSRQFKLHSKKIGPEAEEQRKRDTDNNIILKEAKSKILESIPTYDTDKDIETNGAKDDEEVTVLQTKNVRGENISNKEKDKNSAKASRVYAKERKKKLPARTMAQKKTTMMARTQSFLI